MSYSKEHISQVLFMSILVFFTIPSLHFFTEFIEVPPLKGITATAENPSWTLDTWFDGTYQTEKDTYWKKGFNLREYFIRLNSDRIYKMYGASTNKEVVIGKDNYLFEKVYINEYFGKDYIGIENINHYVSYMKKIQDEFKKRGKAFVIIIAPSKARYYSEFLPDNYIKEDSTNYDVYLQQLKKYGVEYIDMNKWFIGMKDTVAYPLFPQTGIHWSDYGVTYFVDTLMKHLDVVLQKDVADMTLEKIEISKARKADRDIEKLLNLSDEIPIPTSYAYTTIKYQKEGKYRPHILAIGDSFYGTFYWAKDQVQDVFASSSYWYYYNHLYPQDRKRTFDDLAITLQEKEVVLLIGSTHGLCSFGWGAVGDLYRYVNQAPEDVLKNPLTQMIEKIKSDPQWFASVAEKAKEKNISLDSMLYLDAFYILTQDK